MNFKVINKKKQKNFVKFRKYVSLQPNSMSRGVMVTQLVLVQSFKVRILTGQHWRNIKP